jgi:hypothetical protein
MGPLLRAVNAIADAIKPEFPDVAISTLAYQHTMKPPSITKPRPNVIVRLCVGYNDSYRIGAAGNQVFADDLSAWSKISKRIYIWDYVAAFSDFGYMTPYPSWDALAPNIRRLAAAGTGGGAPAVRGLFSEGDDTSMFGDLQVGQPGHTQYRTPHYQSVLYLGLVCWRRLLIFIPTTR